MKSLSLSAIALGIVLSLGIPASVTALNSGGSSLNITNDGSSKYETELAASTDWVAYERISYPENVRQIVAKNLNTGELRIIDTVPDTRSKNINVSGSFITYESQNGDYAGVRVYDVSTGTTKTVPGDFDKFESNTDGINVSFIGFKDGKRDLFVYNIKDQTVTQLTNDYDQESYSSISGNEIALAKYTNGNRQVFVYDIGTGVYKQISTSNEDVFWPRISGDNLVWNTNSKVYAYSLETNTATEIYDGSFNAPYYAFPTSTSISTGKIGYTVSESVNFSGVNSVYLYDLSSNNKTLIDQSSENMSVAVNENQLVYVGGDYPRDNRDIYSFALAPAIPKDTVAPLAKITSPASGAIIYGNMVVKGSVSDNFKLEDYTVILKNSADEIIQSLTYNPENSANAVNDQELLNIDTTKIADGVYTISLDSRDSAGNDGLESHDQAKVTINNIPDSKDQCKNEGYKLFPAGFKNQGECISSIKR